MSLLSLVADLKAALSQDAEILTEASDARFQAHLDRWTDLDKQTPAAIILPTSEKDIQRTVQWAIKNSTPFMAKSGGYNQ